MAEEEVTTAESEVTVAVTEQTPRKETDGTLETQGSIEATVGSAVQGGTESTCNNNNNANGSEPASDVDREKTLEFADELTENGSKAFKENDFAEAADCFSRALEIRCQSKSTKEPKAKRNLLDNASNLLTNFLSGGSLGSMPVAEGVVSDLFGRPLFFSLYDWFLEVIGLMSSGIDNWGHLGGLLGGARVSWLIGPAWKYESMASDGPRIFLDRPPLFYLTDRKRKPR